MPQGFELVFFGDSITQHMRENTNWPVFQKYWTSKYRAYPLGVGSAPHARPAKTQGYTRWAGQFFVHSG